MRSSPCSNLPAVVVAGLDDGLDGELGEVGIHTGDEPRQYRPIFGDPPRTTVHLLWLTATAEDIVEQARRRPDLNILDQRTAPPGGSTVGSCAAATPANISPHPHQHSVCIAKK